MTYTQEVKGNSRKALWKHAVDTLTSSRTSSRILNPDYMASIWSYVWGDVLANIVSVSAEDLERMSAYFYAYWRSYSETSYGEKRPDELRVAYFSGPEPENDLNELLDLGVRIENVWAFESDQATYSQALVKARAEFPLLKIFPGSLTDFLKTNHLSFDIIYLDFTGSLVSRSMGTMGALHASFDEQALSDLSVLVVNSCEPDKTPDASSYLSAYHYFQPMVECSVLGEQPREENGEMISWFSEPASCHGLEPDDLTALFSEDVSGAYSAFATSYPMYYAAFISPTLRFLRNPSLRKQLFSSDKNAHAEAFQRMGDVSDFISELKGESNEGSEPTISGDRIFNLDGFPFWNFIETLKQSAGELGKYWVNEYSRQKEGVSVLDAVKFRESLPETLSGYDGLLSDNIKNEIRRVNAAIPDARGGLFCDVPMAHLWLELALNQLGAPYHANVRNHRRWKYKARVRQMYLDAFTFDRCRALYDALPMVDMYGDVLGNLFPQMMARCCIDAIGKQARWPLANLYFGSNVVCVNEDVDGAEFAEFQARINLDA